MTDSKKRPAGRPFVKGDPRINKHGPVAKERQVFKVEFDNALARRVKMEVLVEKLASLAEHGVEWAMREVLERTLGKVTQPIDGDLRMTGHVVFQMPRPGAKH